VSDPKTQTHKKVYNIFINERHFQEKSMPMANIFFNFELGEKQSQIKKKRVFTFIRHGLV
jgi:hypothetical protein